MKLKTSNKKRGRLIIIIAAVIVAIAAIVAAVLITTRVKNEQEEQDEFNRTETGMIVSIAPKKTVYTVGDEFDPTGISLQVKTNLQDYTYFVDDISEMSFVGFDSSAAADSQMITVIWGGWSAIFTVKIVEPAVAAPTFLGFEVCDLPTEYDIVDWNNYGADYGNTYLLCHWSDGSTTTVDLNLEWATEREYMYAPGTTTIMYEYLGKSVVVEFTITKTETE